MAGKTKKNDPKFHLIFEPMNYFKNGTLLIQVYVSLGHVKFMSSSRHHLDGNNNAWNAKLFKWKIVFQ